MLEPIDLYCERVGPGLLGEPLNMASGLVILGVGLWLMMRPEQPGLSRPLAAVTAVTGLSTVLSHLWPNLVTGIIDLVPTVAFVGLMFFAYARDVLRLRPGEALSAALVIVPFVAASLPLVLLLEGPLASAGYVALPVFILGMAVVLRQRDAGTGLRVMAAAVLLLAALALRAADLPLCGAFAAGTHFLWHLAAAGVIGLLICTYRRHLLAARDAGG